MATTTNLEDLDRAINTAEDLSPLGKTVLRRLFGLDAAGKCVAFERIASDLGVTVDAAKRIAASAMETVRPLL